MKILGRIINLCLPLVLAAAFSATARAQVAGKSANGNAAAACSSFVQGFYDWYLKGQDHPLKRALKLKAGAFDPELLKMLKADAAPQAKADELVGLGFDPVLAAQDPGERYQTGKAAADNACCRVEVFAVVDGKKSKQPAVAPEVQLTEESWRFVNFHYPASENSPDSDLLNILKNLRKERKNSRAPRSRKN